MLIEPSNKSDSPGYQQLNRERPYTASWLSSRRGIAQRLLVLILLFSSVITLIATAVQLYIDYSQEISVIEQRLDDIESSYMGSLSASLWNMDVDQLTLQMQGMKGLPDIQAVEIYENNELIETPLQLTAGSRHDEASISRHLPIFLSDGSENRQLGTLYVEASLVQVYQRLTNKALVILFTQGIKTFLVSLFILLVFYWLVTRHLMSIAQFFSMVDLRHPYKHFNLQRSAQSDDDELSTVVSAFNDMCFKLQDTYSELQSVNVELEKDIEARHRAEQKIMQLNDELEQRVSWRTAELEAANKELAAFCYSVSHDLRAPVRRIQGFKRILEEEYASLFDASGRHYLSRIEVGTKEMSDMIDSFLRLSRSTSAELNIETVDLSLLAEGVERRIREKDANRIVNVEIKDTMLVEGDKRLLEVVLVNLIENAWKYTQRRTNAEITVGVCQMDNETVYYVEDNGAGFDMTLAVNLFTPFQRFHKAEEFDGTGIGLATVQRIVSRHGGRIWADATVDRGAIFYFTLWERGRV